MCTQVVGLEAACAAALALSMLLMLKKYLMDAYTLSPQRVAVFASNNAEKRKAVQACSAAPQNQHPSACCACSSLACGRLGPPMINSG